MASFLVDENVPPRMVSGLRSAGFDVESVQSDTRGSSDEEILALAAREQRVLVTYDTDFGDLIFHRGVSALAGVLLLRLTGSIEDHTERLLEVLANDEDWSLYFTSVGDERVRPRRLSESH